MREVILLINFEYDRPGNVWIWTARDSIDGDVFVAGLNFESRDAAVTDYLARAPTVHRFFRANKVRTTAT